MFGFAQAEWTCLIVSFSWWMWDGDIYGKLTQTRTFFVLNLCELCFIHLYRYLFFYHLFVLEAELLAVGMNIVLGVKLHEFSTHPSHCESIFVIMEKGLAPIETSIPHSYKKNILC